MQAFRVVRVMGHWQLTSRGIEYTRTHSAPLSDEEVEQLAVGFNDIRLTPLVGEAVAAADAQPDAISRLPVAVASPDDRLGEALGELRRAVSIELQETL